MSEELDIEGRVGRLVSWYGDGSDGSAPTAEQWRRLLARPAGTAPTLVNFFKFHESGAETFARYTAVSMPTLEKVGGRFLHVAPFGASLVGKDEDWDLVAIGSYPDTEAVLALFEDEAYREAFAHRRAACARQKVLVTG